MRPESTSLASRNSLCRRLLRGPDARAKFVESHINKGIAYQLRAMREARELSQEELALLVDMPQTAISRLESSNYGKPTITTLKRMARVYDVGLVVRFVPFSKLLNWVSGTSYIENGLSSDALNVPNFEEEEQQGVFRNQTSTPIPVVRLVRTWEQPSQWNTVFSVLASPTSVQSFETESISRRTPPDRVAKLIVGYRVMKASVKAQKHSEDETEVYPRLLQTKQMPALPPALLGREMQI